jgi:Spy/CpxP family protein refolding chaperone
MKQLHTASVLGFLLLASVPVPAQQGPPPGPPPQGPGPMHLEFVLRQVDLTSEQNVQVDALMTARRDAAESTHPAAEAARRALGDQVRAGTFDETAIRAKAAAVAAFDADRAVGDAQLLREVRAVLTAEQRETLDSLLASPPPPPLGGRMRQGRVDAR